MKTLNKHAPRKLFEESINLVITIKLRKEIMKRSALKRRQNISNNPEIIKSHNKQSNYVVNLSRKVKTEYFQKTKYFLSNKTTNFDDKTMLVEVVSKNSRSRSSL